MMSHQPTPRPGFSLIRLRPISSHQLSVIYELNFDFNFNFNLQLCSSHSYYYANYPTLFTPSSPSHLLLSSTYYPLSWFSTLPNSLTSRLIFVRYFLLTPHSALRFESAVLPSFRPSLSTAEQWFGGFIYFIFFSLRLLPVLACLFLVRYFYSPILFSTRLFIFLSLIHHHVDPISHAPNAKGASKHSPS